MQLKAKVAECKAVVDWLKSGVHPEDNQGSNKASDSAMYDEHQEVPDSTYIAGQLLRQHLHQGSLKLSSQCMLGCVYTTGSSPCFNTAMANMVCTVSTSFPGCI